MGELIEKLGIEGSLLVAQIINFAIVALILWKFAYKPVLAMLEKRRKRIEKSIAEAEQIERDRVKMNEEFKAKLDEAKSEAESIIAQAKQTGEDLKADMRKDADAEYKKLLAAASEQIESKQNQAIKELEAETAAIIMKAVAQVTKDGLDEETNKQLVAKTLKELS